jgi:gamma-glutamyltranspeptidase/glutathione hydrolase
MSDTPTETWEVRKPAVAGDRGLVASQHYLASEVGAKVLSDGGNAVDAAVAAGLAIGTVEPWMSGLGGGGFMLIYSAATGKVEAVDFGMKAPAALDPADYPLSGNQGGDLFAWPAVIDNRNVFGPHSIAVPGYIAGMSLALETFGTRSWQASLAPAIALAERGMAVDWYAAIKILAGAQTLAGFEESRRTYMPNGLPPMGEWGGPIPTIRLGNLARTLKRLSDAGAGDFYDGEIARAVAADAQAAGSRLSTADLGGYSARVLSADSAEYRGTHVHVAPGLTAGPTLHHALSLLEQAVDPTGAAPDAEAYGAYAAALLNAYDTRLATMGDANEQTAPSCTTHLTVIDSDGNMVALTQTLLSLFGSKVMLPETGIMMNNGIMWFDPRPGLPNSMAGGKRPLTNMCPTIVEAADGSKFALGASGGRRIMPAVFQLLSFMTDYGMDLDTAFHCPRIDVSGTDVVRTDRRLPDAIATALAGRFDTSPADNAVFPALYACPNGVALAADGQAKTAAAYVMSPWAKAVAAD